MLDVISFVIAIAAFIIPIGAFNAYFRTEHPYIRMSDQSGWFNLCNCMLISLGGPISLFVAVFTTGFFYHGWTLKWRADL